jgi:hypothetical protein
MCWQKQRTAVPSILQVKSYADVSLPYLGYRTLNSWRAVARKCRNDEDRAKSMSGVSRKA